VTAYQEHIVPAAGWFSFDENQGMETIHVIVTNRLLPELLRLLGNEEIQPSRWERVVETFVMAYRHLIGQRQVKDIVYVEAGQEVSHLERPVTQQASQALAVDLATETSGSSTLSPRPSPAVQSGASTAGSSQVATTQPAGQTEAHTEQPSETPADSVRAYETSQVRAERTNSDGAGNHTVQTFVAQAGAMAGEQNVLVHTISLNHR